MKFFIDTANLEQIREAYDLGVLDGVTTNPSLMAYEHGLSRCGRGHGKPFSPGQHITQKNLFYQYFPHIF